MLSTNRRYKRSARVLNEPVHLGGIACALFEFTMDWVEVSVTEWFERCAAGTKPPPDTVTFAPWRVPEQGHERGMYPAVVRNHTRRERPQR